MAFSRPKLILFSLFIITANIAKFFFVKQPAKIFEHYEIFEKNPICRFLLSNNYFLIVFHISGILVSLFTTFVLECALLPSFLLLTFRSILFAPYVDIIFSFVSFGFFFVCLTTKLNQYASYRKFTPILIAITGLYSAFCLSIVVEMVSIGIFSFFVILFFWLKSHKIGNDDASAASDAITTVCIFMISFAGGFFLFRSLNNDLEYSKNFWGPFDTYKIFPILGSRIALSSLPAFISHLEIGKSLICFTAILSAEFFRVFPLATEGVGFDIVLNVSACFYDLAFLIFITGVSTRFIGLFSAAIFLSMSLVLRFVFHVIY